MSFLDKERTIAGPGFNRWLVPPAALAIHLCIGMAYGFSVFWLPLSRAIGLTQPIACGADIGFFAEVFSTTCDWKISLLGWMYSLFFIFLGLSAALFGGWLEHAGPRKAGVVAALCWCGGLVVSALGIYTHQIWLMWLGSGVIGGFGLGLGYISPVSTLIKWFPDRRGMATGMAIMGFGGGAMIGAPLAVALMKFFATPASVGAWQTFLALAAIYFVFMMAGAFGYRVPVSGWKPAGWTAPPTAANSMITSGHVHVSRVWGIPQFWLLWAVLTLNVSAGIGILGMSSPLLQEVFGGRLLGVDVAFNDLSLAQKGQIAAIAAGFTGLLSLFNIGGRVVWASCSDYIGRKNTFYAFFLLGLLLYASIPGFGHKAQLAFFVAAFCVIVSMYGGGFATIPAYIADLFGTQNVGAIHGRILTAWATAGVLGPVLVNYLREYQIASGVPKAQAYDVTMYVLAAMILAGLVCNALVRPIAAKHFMNPQALALERKLAHERDSAGTGGNGGNGDQSSGTGKGGGATSPVLLVLAWAAVGIPLAIGIGITLQKAVILFH